MDISLLKTESQITPKTTLKRKRSTNKISNKTKNKSSKKKRIRKSRYSIKQQDDDSHDESDNDDKEYKPKRLNISSSTKQLTPRVQRSPLAKARKASPISFKKDEKLSRRKVPLKVIEFL